MTERSNKRGGPIIYNTDKTNYFPEYNTIFFVPPRLIMSLNVIIYGIIDLVLTYIILNSPYLEFNPIANFNFYLFILVKIIVLAGIYILMIQTQRNFPGLILLFISVVATLYNLQVLFL